LANITLLVFDVDGTITDRNRRLCLECVSAIRKAEESGVMTVMATGNILPVALSLSEFIGSSGPVIAENGGVIFFRDKYEKEIIGDRSRCTKVLEILKREGIKYARTTTDMCRLSEVTLTREVSVELIRKIIRKYNIKDVKVVDTYFAIHIMCSEVNKGLALKRVLEHLNISPENVLYVGDSENDIEAFRLVRYSAALANAPEFVKREALYVTSRPYGAGFLEALRHFKIIEG